MTFTGNTKDHRWPERSPHNTRTLFPSFFYEPPKSQRSHMHRPSHDEHSGWSLMYETHTFTDTREHVKLNIATPPTRPHPPAKNPPKKPHTLTHTHGSISWHLVTRDLLTLNMSSWLIDYISLSGKIV